MYRFGYCICIPAKRKLYACAGTCNLGAIYFHHYFPFFHTSGWERGSAEDFARLSLYLRLYRMLL